MLSWYTDAPFTALALVAALGGTIAQAWTGVTSLRHMPIAREGITVHEFMSEVPVWRPRARRDQRRELKKLLRGSRGAYESYRFVRWTVVSWSMLTMACSFALIGHITHQ